MVSSPGPAEREQSSAASLTPFMVSAVLVAASTCVPALHPAYGIGTLLLLVTIGALPAVWPTSFAPGGRASTGIAMAGLLAGMAAAAPIVWRLLPAVFAAPLDPNRGDMLVIVQHAIAKFLAGGNPYSVHQVPWDAPLSYGPVLWAPFVVPHLLRTDFRILTLIAQLVVPLAAFSVAALRIAGGHVARGLVLASLGGALLLNPAIGGFHSIGHTQVYWPLMLLFCGALAAERWTPAAVCLGLLVAARTTMVSLVIPFFIYLGIHGRFTMRRAIAFVLAAGLPFLPFLIADPATLWYAMVGVYMKVMKGYVWQSTRWALDTYGLTGRLLERGLGRFVELSQLISIAAAVALSARAMRRGSRAEPWLVVALLVFSMTTLWPVLYLYFDVWVLAVSALIAAEAVSLPWRNAVPRAAALAACGALALVLTAAAFRPGASYVVDVGTPEAAGLTGGGFGRDEAATDEGRSVVWIGGESARVRLPRAAWTGATIRMAIRPHPAPGLPAQQVFASLNGRRLGTARLDDAWQEISFTTRARDWYYGFNVLDLTFTRAGEPAAANGRRPSAAIDWIAVE